jgi:hypothetical protein
MIFKELKPEETELVGMWLNLGMKVRGDAVAANSALYHQGSSRALWR